MELDTELKSGISEAVSEMSEFHSASTMQVTKKNLTVISYHKNFTFTHL
jgi:hypothetical protein